MKAKSSKKRIIFMIALFVVLLQTFFAHHVREKDNVAPITPVVQITNSQPKQSAKVLYIVDGDTIVIEGKKTVRYIGVDTPETKHPKETLQCFGREASEKNKELVEGKYIYLEKDVSETDIYGRLLRYVWVDNIFVNDYLIRQGYAHAATFPPDVKYSQRFLESQKEAQQNSRGLWKSCKISL